MSRTKIIGAQMTNQPVQGGSTGLYVADHRISFGLTQDDKGGIYFKRTTSFPRVAKLFVEVLGSWFSHFSVVSIDKKSYLVSRDSLARFIASHRQELGGLHSDDKQIKKLMALIQKSDASPAAIEAQVKKLWGSQIEKIINHIGLQSSKKAEEIENAKQLGEHRTNAKNYLNSIRANIIDTEKPLKLSCTDDKKVEEAIKEYIRSVRTMFNVQADNFDPKVYFYMQEEKHENWLPEFIFGPSKVEKYYVFEQKLLLHDIIAEAILERDLEKIPKNNNDLKILENEHSALLNSREYDKIILQLSSKVGGT